MKPFLLSAWVSCFCACALAAPVDKDAPREEHSIQIEDFLSGFLGLRLDTLDVITNSIYVIRMLIYSYKQEHNITDGTASA